MSVSLRCGLVLLLCVALLGFVRARAGVGGWLDGPMTIVVGALVVVLVVRPRASRTRGR